MRAVIIDAENCKIREVDIKKGKSLEAMQKAVEGLIELAGDIPISAGDSLFVNEEGMFDDSLSFFEVEGMHQPFSGNGIIVGTGSNGETISAKVNIEELKKIVSFVDRSTLQERYNENPSHVA